MIFWKNVETCGFWPTKSNKHTAESWPIMMMMMMMMMCLEAGIHHPTYGNLNGNDSMMQHATWKPDANKKCREHISTLNIKKNNMKEHWNNMISSNYPLVNIQKAIENCHIYSWITHKKMVIFHGYVNVYQRVNSLIHRLPKPSPPSPTLAPPEDIQMRRSFSCHPSVSSGSRDDGSGPKAWQKNRKVAASLIDL